MNKGNISNFLRSLRLMHLTDRVRYYIQSRKNRKANQAFLQSNPTVKLPPDYLMYESFQINYKKYLNGGKSVADWVVSHMNKYVNKSEVTVLDWGCGPGRVVRHLPDMLSDDSQVHGTDYNAKSIAWCTEHLSGITFHHNGIEPNLDYADRTFDFIYGISILTHLSEDMHYGWVMELLRVLKPGGVVMLTTQGDNFKTILTAEEKMRYDRGDLVVRGKVVEGHRTFSAFQPDAFMRSLFSEHEILMVEIQKVERSKAIPQDAWLVRKR